MPVPSNRRTDTISIDPLCQKVETKSFKLIPTFFPRETIGLRIQAATIQFPIKGYTNLPPPIPAPTNTNYPLTDTRDLQSMQVLNQR
ncbi:uncharacterized protein N7518_008349 [Penicillium psychrosexuale]|uniref:uncharacterized protein n=1 Tax=Penicillium psychrosexuale TaxID=1002107 RepID=UPI002544E3E6|nr:uncharacterized protein N7518_008349 [Penicillium psychrosexuale]KAJ5791338.1 hypothetical protein N7518_008349 [Penicillium psychrosexuale]